MNKLIDTWGYITANKNKILGGSIFVTNNTLTCSDQGYPETKTYDNQR